MIDVWHPWGGRTEEDFRRAVEAFNRTHPGIRARTLYVPNDLSNSQKIYISVAGGVPPDVTFVDGPQVAQWAHLGVLDPLDDLVEKAGIGPGDFWAPCWRQNLYRGSSYALTYCADPNFAFFWNKRVFRDAGLPSDRPPRTLDELDRYARRITEYDGERLVRTGIIPWAVYGGANSIFTWGWVFGGSFFDYETSTVTADHPRIVKALEWIVSYAEEYDVRKIAGLQATFGSAQQNPFIVGKLGMQPLHIMGLWELEKYAPDLEYGVSALPGPPGGEENSSWVGGWCMGIPKGLQTHREEAFEFVRWMCATPEGTTFAARSTGSFPGYRHSPVYAEARKDPRKRAFLEILEACKHQRPVMPAQAYFMGELDRAVSAAIYGRMSPEDALRRATRRTQKRLDRVLKRGRKR